MCVIDLGFAQANNSFRTDMESPTLLVISVTVPNDIVDVIAYFILSLAITTNDTTNM